MGFSGVSIWQLLIILLIVLMLFGTKRLSSLGADLGSAVRGFKKAIRSEDTLESSEQQAKPIDSEAIKQQKERH